jgi:hypothetical protein
LLNTQSPGEETIATDHSCSDAELARASQRLTAALKPAKARPASPEPTATIRVEPAPTPVPETQTAVTAPTVQQRPGAPLAEPLPPSPSPRSSEPGTVASKGEKSVGKPAERTIAPAAAAASKGPAASQMTPSTNPPVQLGRAEHPVPSVPDGPALDPAVMALFSQTDPLRINAGIFRRLADRFDVAVQDVSLSLPWVFTERRFEILSFSGQEIGSVLDLRSEEFYGFYLSHISERRTDFVYACRGTHIEWGPDKCVLQASAQADAMEFAGSALLAMGQTGDDVFVFVVTSAYKQWVKPYEARCRAAFAQFLAVNDLAADPDSATKDWVWQGWVR